MSTLPSGKYQLKSLHEEIGLFDRKLSYVEKYETFPNEEDRTAALRKLSTKRNLLIRKAQQMIDEGIEFKEIERPKSLRPEALTEDVVPAAVIEPPAEPIFAAASEPLPSPYAGTSLDYQTNLLEYKKRPKASAN